MADEITVASTTDEIEDVQAAANVTPDDLEEGRTPESKQEPPREAHREGRTALQRRFDRLTRERYEQQERIQQLEARLREVDESTRPEARRPEPEPTERAEPEAERAKPETDVREERPPAPSGDERARQIHSKFVRDFDAALPKGSADRAALEQAANRTQSEVGGIHTGVAQIVMSMPNSIDCYAHLCTHPEDLRVLNASRSPAEALANVRYISGVLAGMVRARQAQPAERPRPAVKKPPEPIRPVRGAASRSEPSLEDADYQSYKRLRSQQERNRYR